jgi:hypothetical protein
VRIYFGPWEWRERVSSKTGLAVPGGFGWRMPTGCTQAIDLRVVGDAGTTEGEQAGRALFLAPDDVLLASPWTQVASDPLETLTRLRIAAIETLVGLTTAETRLANVLHDLTTRVGGRLPKRVASSSRRIRWLFGGQAVLDVEVGRGAPEWDGLRERHTQAYRVIRALGLPLLSAKYLGYLARKYRLTAAQTVADFIPADLTPEDPVAPTTTLTESFPGTSATLGGDQTWTEVTGAWENATGVGHYLTTNNSGYARCEGTLSSDDMRVQAATTGEQVFSYGGPNSRYASAANTFYGLSANNVNNDYYGNYVVGGSSTDIITSELSGTIGLPVTTAIEVNGDEIEIFSGATSRGSTTHTLITGNVRAGVYWYQGNASDTYFDDWQANDLAVAATSFVIPTTTMMQSILAR